MTMLGIVYSPDLEIIGAVTVTLLALWTANLLWNEFVRSVDRRRRRQRRRIERALVARTRCGSCGSRRLRVEEPEPTDRERVAQAVGEFVRRARTEASAR